MFLFVFLAICLWGPAIQAADSNLDKEKTQFFHLLARAQKGDVEAERSVGLALAQGKGCAKDQEQAILWLERAAKKKDQWAQNGLGFLYAQKGREQDAKYWYEAAVKQGNELAKSNLAGVLAREGGKDNVARAQALYKSAGKSEPRALYNLAQLHLKLGQREKAIGYLKQALNRGVVSASYQLGSLYEDNDDSEQAIVYYKTALKQGSQDALARLEALGVTDTNLGERQPLLKGRIN